mgnify:FL=1
MITKEQLLEAQEYISGTCMTTPENALDTIIKRECTEEEHEEFLAFLEHKEVFECDTCGWWTHPDEGDGTTCDECLYPLEDDEAEFES